MSLYAKYIREREGKEIVESPVGFATFKISGEECYIVDVFIIPEARRSGAAIRFAEEIVEIAKNRNCKYLTGSVTPSLPGATASMKLQLGYGMKIHEAMNDFIILKKEL